MTEQGPVYPIAPPARIDLGDGIAVVRVRPERARSALVAINESLDHLRPWMAWAKEPATEASIGTFFATSEALWDQRRDFGYSIIDVAPSGAPIGDDVVLGGSGLHGRAGADQLDIGYWVHVDRGGRGLATSVSRALTSAAFEVPGVERVRIQCEDTNHRSARVPERLGYRFDGVSVPDDGPCAARPTQTWMMDRAAWSAS